jgi:branched-chain amino acid transport system permease protein
MVDAAIPSEAVRRRVVWSAVARRIPLVISLGMVAFALIWVLFWAPSTTFGPAIDDPIDFFKVFLDSLTFAGVLFVVASGFTLIFGLMRVVNMAHGSLYLLGGYIAFDLQQKLAGGVGGFALLPQQVTWWDWIVPALVAAACMGVIGLIMQQCFLRWTQGQDLRQALITIAISIILADQMLQHWPLQESITWPKYLSFDAQGFYTVGSVAYARARLFMLAVAVVIGVALWLWLQKTRAGMVIRAGVDDRQMVSALGVNIQLFFLVAFVVGAALAGFGGAMGGAQFGLGPGQDGQWLLNSLIVVIIGGMGSLGGAAVGALLYAFVADFSAVYLPTTGDNCCTQYSSIFTFALLVAVLALRPLGLFGRPA